MSAVKDPRDGMEIIPSWADDGTAYVDGRLTRNQARHLYCEETGAWYKTCTARRCYMRIITGDEALEYTQGEFEDFWRTCEKDDEGALSMWLVRGS